MTDDQFVPETEASTPLVTEVPQAEEPAVDAPVAQAPVAAASAEDASGEATAAPQYGIGPFTIREVAIAGVWLAAFVVSFFPVLSSAVGSPLGGGQSVWLSGLDWILTIAVPTVAVFLIILRRLSPTGIRRVGSLGIDQFASVAFSLSAVVWLAAVWQTVTVAIGYGQWIRGWVVWVEFALALIGVVLTVFAPFIPPFRQDFEGRPQAPAHRNARPVRAVTARPPRPKPVPMAAPVAAPEPHAYQTGVYETPAYQTGTGVPAYQGAAAAPAYQADAAAPAHQAEPVQAEPVAEPATEPAAGTSADASDAAYGALGFDAAELATPAEDETPGPHYARTGSFATQEPVDEPAAAQDAVAAQEPAQNVHQAFWALASTERDVHDEQGMPLFRIGPTAWALVIEDRGSLFVIRHEDGRIGYLHDVTGVTRG